MRIERLENSKHKQERVLVYLEDGTLLRITGAELLQGLLLHFRGAKKGASPEDAAETADWLEDLGAVEDTAYAGVIVRHYGAMGCGAARVRQELHRRGVPKELWDEALEQLPPPQEAIEKFLCAKLRGRPLTPEDSRRLAAALQRRGFSWQDIRPILNGLGQEIDET